MAENDQDTGLPSALIGRREVLRGAAVLAVPFATSLTGCTTDEETPEPFVHGVASGDPLPNGVILWTRLTAKSGDSLEAEWEVADDPAMTKRVANGVARTDASRDFTIKVDVTGLQPGHTYFYRFRALGVSSKVARTRTAPAAPTPQLRLAIMACASLAHGYFHGYRALSKQLDLDFVLHLGDYIYEYADGDFGDVRKYEPSHEIITLADYRMRHAQYKREPDLQEVHRQHVFITIWDDHETANDAYKDGAGNHSPDEGSFEDRKNAARRAYMEWMPIREQESPERIFRTLPFGDLADLVLLDTRLYARTEQSGGFLGSIPPPDPNRTLLGDEQATWLEDQLKASKARWKFIGQQVMVGNLIIDKGKQLANLDQWHGYPESRKRLLDFFRTSGVKDIVVLTGDIHSSWAIEVVDDPNDAVAYDPKTGRGSLAVEFVTPGITSPGIPEAFLGLVEQVRPINPHVKFVEPSRRGFVILDVTHERVQAAWHLFEDIVAPEPVSPTFRAAWSVRTGETRLTAEAIAAPPFEGRAGAAP